MVAGACSTKTTTSAEPAPRADPVKRINQAIEALNWDAVEAAFNVIDNDGFRVCSATEADWDSYVESEDQAMKSRAFEFRDDSIYLIEMSGGLHATIAMGIDDAMLDATGPEATGTDHRVFRAFRDAYVDTTLESAASKLPKLSPDCCYGPARDIGAIKPPRVHWNEFHTFKVEVGVSQGWRSMDTKVLQYCVFPGLRYVLCVFVSPDMSVHDMVNAKAIEVACDHGISVGFSASRSWLERFLHEHDLLVTTRRIQEFEATLQAEIDALCLKHKIKKIYRAEQTGINYEYIPKPAGSVNAWVRCGGSERDRITAMLLGDADGNKYPLFLVMKSDAENHPDARQGFDTAAWEDMQIIQEETGGVVFGNPTATWNSDLSLAFLRFHFGRRAHLNENVLLVWGVHWTADVQAYADEINVTLHRAQPTNAVWKSTLMNRLRRIWIDSLRAQVAYHTSMAHFVLQPPCRIELAAWVQSTWDSLSRNTIQKGFKMKDDDLVASSRSPNVANEEDDAVSCLEPSLLEALVNLKIAHDVNADEDSDSSPERQRLLRSPADKPVNRAMGEFVGRSATASRPGHTMVTLPRVPNLVTVPSFPQRLTTRADRTEITA
ncbi:hypothetical protein SPRG_21768 [Saprolegnia parasitica CBS 223.65]|uniref:HTH CENPB-type domain-containing protein n=1 Tax=Saprolegnia parasitica (strain CBS 223.65) TaxID=695850 RepID=A0A067BTQ9_SAPPC|nr:hypothetical protein SPRG_21768 [Saprolegnia parasitica CBS 223.65]KDO18037.1 hypothetical protein SPRG_21768 [Saprolegnia parasitica CBS 223.65]|eukprot:XP_012211254.1 hypothetical protein SPRG_21768 [Saprolegnia parasitica CBS 223.65]